jgi:hypothetical protein
LNAAGLSLSSNVVSALNSTSNITTTANVTGGNLITAALAQAATLSATANVQAGNLRTTGLISATGAITGAAITGTSLTVSTGNVTLGNIINANGNAVGNIGSSTVYFNTLFAKATSAQYADLAEMYLSDADYAPGTVLIFGGEQEVTADIVSHSTAIAGVVSEKPSHLMNAGLQGKHVVAVALLGRVPCQVQGTVRKGDLLVASDTPGVSQRLNPDQYRPGCVIGKALANYVSDTVGTIEIAVGVK